MILHAGLVASHSAGEWRGALIQGPSGAGKSDLALRALALGLALVSDDRTLIWNCQGRLFGTCPAPLAGLIEARGAGVMRTGERRLSQILLLVDCMPLAEPVERMPEVERHEILGVQLPVLRLHALEASSALKLQWALSRLGAWP
jgi:serine kinase of HPr protein (carbohydrate metabolism regulator)